MAGNIISSGLNLMNTAYNGAGGIVISGDAVKGGYFVTDIIANIPSWSNVTGTLCFCTADSEFYQYNGTNWVKKEFGSTAEATTTSPGLMSANDKVNLDTIVNSFNSEDGDATINTIKEVLKAFENAPEGTNIATALSAKSDIGHTHTVGTTNVAPHAHTHNVTVSGTTGGNSGTAVKAVTGVAADGTATVLTGVTASATEKFIKTISGGSGSLTTDAVVGTDGIQYLESVEFVPPTPKGSFNTNAIKDVTLAASTTSTDGPKYVESVTHTAATLGGTTTFNTNAIKSVKLSASSTSTDGPVYVQGVSGSAPSLTGDTTFVKVQGTLSGGSGSLEAYDAAANGTKKVSNGTRVPVVTSVTHTAATLGTASTSSAAPGGHKHSYDKTTGVTLTANDATATGRVKYVQEISGSAPTLSGIQTFVTGVTAGSGSLTSDNTPTDGISYVSAQGALSYTSTNSGGSSGITGTIASYSNGVLTINATVNSGEHTHTYDKATLANATTKYLHHSHTSASSSGTGTVSISGGSYSATTKYLSAAPSNTATESAANGGTNFNAVTGYNSFSGGSISPTTYYLDHGHTAASLGSATTGTVGITGGSYTADTKYMKASGTSADTETVTISGGSITPVTRYMKKTTTAASTGSVDISGGSIKNTVKYLHHKHTGASASSSADAITEVVANGTATVLTGVKASSTADVAPNNHTHSYGSSTALTTENNSGNAVAAVTEVKPSEK